MDAKVRRRIYPELRIKKTQALTRIAGILGVLVGIGLLVGNIVLSSRDPGLKRWVFGLVGLSMIYYGLLWSGVDLAEWLFALIHHRTWKGLQVMADGEIVDRTVKRRVDSEGSVSYTYWLTFRFDSTEGPVSLKARVDKECYERFNEGDPVAVRYARENPRLALLEEEWDK